MAAQTGQRCAVLPAPPRRAVAAELAASMQPGGERVGRMEFYGDLFLPTGGVHDSWVRYDLPRLGPARDADVAGVDRVIFTE